MLNLCLWSLNMCINGTHSDGAMHHFCLLIMWKVCGFELDLRHFFYMLIFLLYIFCLLWVIEQLFVNISDRQHKNMQNWGKKAKLAFQRLSFKYIGISPDRPPHDIAREKIGVLKTYLQTKRHIKSNKRSEKLPILWDILIHRSPRYRKDVIETL